MIQPLLPSRLPPLFMMFLVFFILVMQGCGGGNNEPRNTAPSFTSGTGISMAEGTTATGYTATATDTDGDTVTFSLSGGADQEAFNIDSDSGVLSFISAPDFDMPTDSGGDNIYEVEITATDGAVSVVQTVSVTVVYVADYAGYYNNTGSASVENGMGGTILVNDLQAMVNGDGTRIIMMSAANKLLYDGTISNISGNDFTADFTIYTDGENPVTASASGTITAGSSITGTLTGTGVGSGTFSLLYATTNDQAAAVTRTWLGFDGVGFDQFGFIIDGTGNLAHDRTAGSTLFDTCKMNGTVVPVSGTRLYHVDVALTDCNDPIVDGDYTGLTTTRDESVTDDRLVFAVSNGTYTLSGEFNPD